LRFRSQNLQVLTHTLQEILSFLRFERICSFFLLSALHLSPQDLEASKCFEKDSELYEIFQSLIPLVVSQWAELDQKIGFLGFRGLLGSPFLFFRGKKSEIRVRPAAPLLLENLDFPRKLLP
jgi:hypothetical protein